MPKQVDTISYKSVVRPPYDQEAIIRDNFPGFKEDYLVIHSLIRRYQPYRFMEIGTSSGAGTNVICNAMRIRKWLPNQRRVMSIDVPPGTNPKEIYPDENPEDGHPERAGSDCTFPYQQIFGNSLGFDFSPYYPVDAWFIDGKHNYKFAKNDSELALKSDPILIMWHDMQMDEVNDAVHDVMKEHPEYELGRVDGTRMGVAVRRLI